MKLIYILKVCVFAAFIGTIFTGFLFVMHSSDEQQIRAHAKDIYGNQRNAASNNELGKNDESLALKNVHGAEISTEFRESEFNVAKPPSQPDAEPVKETVTTPAIVEKPKTIPTTTTTTTKVTTTTTKVETIAPKVLKELKETSRTPSVHIFYYPWYGAPEFDNGTYFHWNHIYLKPDGTPVNNKSDHHYPPGDVASISYPELGPYSSQNPDVIERHMRSLSSSGIDVVAVSWYPKDKADGKPLDPLFPLLLNITDKFKMKLTFHLEPYESRSAQSIRNDIKYIISTYGSHPAFYRTTGKADSKNNLPLFYVYDSYLIEPAEWQEVTLPNGSLTIRNTELDSLLIGLYVNAGDDVKLKSSGFDGLYTYFASDGFSHGSTMSNWPNLSTFCAKENLLFIPSVGPGYDDSRVRPWNGKNTRSRNNGEYYKEHFKMAHTAKADIVSITSFNEWNEGTQIEPAVPFTDKNGTEYVYTAYEKGPEQYLEITLEMVKAYFTPHHENIPMQIARVV